MNLKCFIISFLMFCTGYLTSSSQSCNRNEKENHCLETKDSVWRKSISTNFEDIHVIHENNDNERLHSLKRVEAWEARRYFSRQRDIIEEMENNMLKKIPAQKLNGLLDYKFNPIICILNVSAQDGVVKKVSFQIFRRISSLISDEDFLMFDNVILNTRFRPDDSMSGDLVSYCWVISRKRIRDFLRSQQNQNTEKDESKH